MNPPCDAGCGRPARYALDLDGLPRPVFVCCEHLKELKSSGGDA